MKASRLPNVGDLVYQRHGLKSWIVLSKFDQFRAVAIDMQGKRVMVDLDVLYACYYIQRVNDSKNEQVNEGRTVS